MQDGCLTGSSKFRFGSFVCIRSGSKLGLVTGDEPTFGSGGRQWDGERTLRRGEAKDGFVPRADNQSVMHQSHGRVTFRDY